MTDEAGAAARTIVRAERPERAGSRRRIGTAVRPGRGVAGVTTAATSMPRSSNAMSGGEEKLACRPKKRTRGRTRIFDIVLLTFAIARSWRTRPGWFALRALPSDEVKKCAFVPPVIVPNHRGAVNLAPSLLQGFPMLFFGTGPPLYCFPTLALGGFPDTVAIGTARRPLERLFQADADGHAVKEIALFRSRKTRHRRVGCRACPDPPSHVILSPLQTTRWTTHARLLPISPRRRPTTRIFHACLLKRTGKPCSLLFRPLKAGQTTVAPHPLAIA